MDLNKKRAVCKQHAQVDKLKVLAAISASTFYTTTTTSTFIQHDKGVNYSRKNIPNLH